MIPLRGEGGMAATAKISKLLCYNVQSLIQPGRKAMLQELYKNYAIVTMIATQEKQDPKQPIPVERTVGKEWIEYTARIAPGGNKAAGIKVCLNKKYFGSKSVVQVAYPPRAVQGRALATWHPSVRVLEYTSRHGKLSTG